MNRSGLLYQVRRNVQIVLCKILGYRMMTKIYYKVCLKKACDLKNPKTLNEKICWLKVNDFENNELIVNCTDKYKSRKYVENKLGSDQILVPLLGVWNNADEIDFSKLPQQFILKCNHGCAYNILVDNKDILDVKSVVKKLNRWLKEDFSLFNAEPQYHKITRKIICEKHIGNNLVDYKFFCTKGNILFFYISSDLLNDRQASMCHYLPDGSKSGFQRNGYREYDFPIVPQLDEMKKLARKLSEEFDFVRVDFMVAGNKVYFSELTFTPGGGYNEMLNQKEFDKMGKHIKLPI